MLQNFSKFLTFNLILNRDSILLSSEINSTHYAHKPNYTIQHFYFENLKLTNTMSSSLVVRGNGQDTQLSDPKNLGKMEAMTAIQKMFLAGLTAANKLPKAFKVDTSGDAIVGLLLGKMEATQNAYSAKATVLINVPRASLTRYTMDGDQIKIQIRPVKAKENNQNQNQQQGNNAMQRQMNPQQQQQQQQPQMGYNQNYGNTQQPYQQNNRMMGGQPHPNQNGYVGQPNQQQQQPVPYMNNQGMMGRPNMVQNPLPQQMASQQNFGMPYPNPAPMNGNVQLPPLQHQQQFGMNEAPVVEPQHLEEEKSPRKTEYWIKRQSVITIGVPVSQLSGVPLFSIVELYGLTVSETNNSAEVPLGSPITYSYYVNASAISIVAKITSNLLYKGISMTMPSSSLFRAGNVRKRPNSNFRNASCLVSAGMFLEQERLPQELIKLLEKEGKKLPPVKKDEKIKEENGQIKAIAGPQRPQQLAIENGVVNQPIQPNQFPAPNQFVPQNPPNQFVPQNQPNQQGQFAHPNQPYFDPNQAQQFQNQQQFQKYPNQQGGFQQAPQYPNVQVPLQQQYQQQQQANQQHQNPAKKDVPEKKEESLFFPEDPEKDSPVKLVRIYYSNNNIEFLHSLPTNMEQGCYMASSFEINPKTLDTLYTFQTKKGTYEPGIQFRCSGLQWRYGPLSTMEQVKLKGVETFTVLCRGWGEKTRGFNIYTTDVWSNFAPFIVPYSEMICVLSVDEGQSKRLLTNTQDDNGVSFAMEARIEVILTDMPAVIRKIGFPIIPERAMMECDRYASSSKIVINGVNPQYHTPSMESDCICMNDCNMADYTNLTKDQQFDFYAVVAFNHQRPDDVFDAYTKLDSNLSELIFAERDKMFDVRKMQITVMPMPGDTIVERIISRLQTTLETYQSKGFDWSLLNSVLVGQNVQISIWAVRKGAGLKNDKFTPKEMEMMKDLNQFFNGKSVVKKEEESEEKKTEKSEGVSEEKNNQDPSEGPRVQEVDENGEEIKNLSKNAKQEEYSDFGVTLEETELDASQGQDSQEKVTPPKKRKEAEESQKPVKSSNQQKGQTHPAKHPTKQVQQNTASKKATPSNQQTTQKQKKQRTEETEEDYLNFTEYD
jgi:hypothetical protein